MFLIIFTGNESTKICGSAKIECYQEAQKKLFEEDIIDGLTNKKAELVRRKCHCLPSCTTITWEAITDRTKFYWREALKRTLNWTQQELNAYAMLINRQHDLARQNSII